MKGMTDKSSRSHRGPPPAAAAAAAVSPPQPRRRTPRPAPPQRLPWPTTTTRTIVVTVAHHEDNGPTTTFSSQAPAPAVPSKVVPDSFWGAGTTTTGTNQKKRPPPHYSPRPIIDSSSSRRSSTHSSHNNNDNNKKRTTRRQVTFRATTGAMSPPQPSKVDDRLWIDAHAPQTLDEVCVAPKKIREIRHWLNSGSSSSTTATTTGDGDGGSGLLIVVGNPGIGKSTAVHCLARELGRPILEWTESVASHQRSADTTDLAQPSPLDSLEQFLQQARAGYGAIPTTTPSIIPPNRMPTPTTGPTKAPQTSGPPLILLDELPNLHGRDMEERFRDFFTQHVIESSSWSSSSSSAGQQPHHRTPTVWIYSRVAEGKHQKEDLERLVEPRVLYDPQYCQILSIHPPTKSRFTKIVDRIAAQRGVRNVHSSALYETCGGDLRFAITALQLEGSAVGRGRSNNSLTNPLRDERLNPFHALGKLLYAKRMPPPFTSGAAPLTAAPVGIGSRWRDERPPLDFDPDTVLDRSEMELPQALQFLEYHAIDFMTDLVDVSQVLSCYSDAACLCDRLMMTTAPHGNRGSARHHSGHHAPSAVAIASRAVAAYNLHPAPSRFRQFGAPRIFEVLRKRSTNREQLRHALSQSPRLLGVDQYAIDCLSLVRKIRPDRPLAWQSFLGPSSSNGDDAVGLFEPELLPSQLAFENDDIDEFSDHDESHD